MNFIETLKKYDLYPTDYSKPTIIDAVRAIYNLNGKNFLESESTKIIKTKLKNKKHFLFILSDGMGCNLIDNLDSKYTLKKNKLFDLQTVNPSTTGCAVPSIVTGQYPCTHGLLGWLSHNREFNLDYLTVLFQERISGKSLDYFQISPNDIFKSKSVINSLNRNTFALFPEDISNTTFSKFILDSNQRLSYKSIPEAFNIFQNTILKSNSPTYTYMYFPQVDSNEHKYGVFSQEVQKVIDTLETEINKLFPNNDLEIVITADHGQIDITNDPIRMDFEKYQKYFYAYPGIDVGTATYYVKKEYFDEFEKEFKKDYDNKMFLFKIDEVIKSNIFGNEEMSNYMKSNLGEYLSFCTKGSYFINSIEEDEFLNNLKGNHSGFSKDEIYIPLIIIN